jgi:hypothetical protein
MVSSKLTPDFGGKTLLGFPSGLVDMGYGTKIPSA